MDYFKLIFFGLFALVVGSLLFGRLKYGSWTGAFLRGSVEQTYGEILISSGIAGSQLLKVVELRDTNSQAFVGLVIPHLARMAVGPSFDRLLPTAMLMGASYLLLVDTLARTMARIEVPIGILTAIIGAPFFLWLLAKGREGWS